ncbi:MAG TPA: hypothetical protein DCE42_19125 [Myxococcales bacterium]|nr:hypothetical protein [Deltaproteobacteria bacterium]HAA56887.1 hypothetical protein [Myxococcales bacterium]|tara:strand:- start:1606 stop:2784 length:1179 start_codon:yes stop_codon:yes gene_type:complete
MQKQTMPLHEIDDTSPRGLVLSGGGARGAFQVGVWEILRNNPMGFQSTPEVLSGTSAGSLNCAFIASGLSPKEMLEFWLSLADTPPIRANERFFSHLIQALRSLAIREPIRQPFRRVRELKTLKRLLGKHSWMWPGGASAMWLEFLLTARFDSVSQILDKIATVYLFDTTPLRKRLRDFIGSTTVPRTDIKLAINTVDIKTGNVVRYINHPTIHQSTKTTTKHYVYEKDISLDMLLASASIPLLFNPIKIRERFLWDGGVLVNTPLAPAVALGAKRIVPVLVTTKEHENDDSLKTFGGAIERLADAFLENAYNIDRKLMLERNTLASHVPKLGLTEVELYKALRPAPDAIFNAGSYLYFEREAMTAMYEAGKRAALRWLSKGPEVDDRESEG